VGFSRLI